MSVELSWAPSDRGELSLIQLTDGLTGRHVHEIRLDGELVISSQTSERDRVNVRHALDALTGNDWDIVMCGLGLGFAACAALDDDRVRSLLVLEPEEGLVEWCRARLLPNAKRLFADPRARIVRGDLRAAVATDRVDPHAAPGKRVDALLVDVAVFGAGPDANAAGRDHAETVDLKRVLRPDGILALWCDDLASITLHSATRVLERVEVEQGQVGVQVGLG